MKTIIVQCAALLFAATAVLAGPPIWEADYGQLVPPADPLDGSSRSGLINEDDAQSEITFSFPFPFEGIGYRNAWVSTDGCLQLGTLGFDGTLDYDMWQSFEEFYDDGDELGDAEPVICPFNSDLDLTVDGAVWFNDLGDRIVVTWDEVGTNFEETHHLTFQVSFLADGTIIFGYDGVLDGEGESRAASSFGGALDEGIVVGVSESEGTYPTPSIDFDLNGPAFAGGETIFERWCYDRTNSCGEDERNLGYSGLKNFMWDLEGQNVILTPREGNGFDVRSEGVPPPPSRRRPVGRPGDGESARIVSIKEDFRTGTRGWIPGVIGGSEGEQQLVPVAGPRRLPSELGGDRYAMMLRGAGENLSTFMTKRIGAAAGLVGGRTYVAEVAIELAGEWEETGALVRAGVASSDVSSWLDDARDASRVSIRRESIVDRSDRAGARTIQRERSLVSTGVVPELWLVVAISPGAGEETVLFVDSVSLTLTPVPHD